MPPAISIGCQQGGPEPCLISNLKVILYKALEAHVTGTHCPEIDEYALVLRVDGSLDKFGDEGLARLRFAKAKRYITIDIQIPEYIWQPMSEVQTAQYLATQVQTAIRACTQRLVKEKCPVDTDTLNKEINLGIDSYLSITNGG